MERGGVGVDCARRDIERCGGAFVLGSGADVSHSSGHAARFTRVNGVRGAWSLRRLRVVDLRQVTELSAAEAATTTGRVPNDAALRGWFAGGGLWGFGCG